MRGAYHAAIVSVLAVAAPLFAAPPALDLPTEVRPAQGYARLTPKTDAVSVTYVALDGLYPFPSEELKDARRFVLPTAGVKPGRYRYVAVAAAKNGEQASAEFVVVVPGEVKPDPTPDPKPVDPPAPVKVESFRVIFVYEKTATLTESQYGAIYGRKVADYLNAACAKSGPRPDWRIFDKDDTAVTESGRLAELWADQKPKVAAVPCVIVEINGVPKVHPLPAGQDAAVAFLKSLRGDK